MTNLRVGSGYDVHQLESNLPLLIGGILIPHNKGIVAHSDGDILIHALSDALLGAAGLGDIGHFFPDTDFRYKDIDSSEILFLVLKKLSEQSFQLVNIDITIVLEKPKLQPFIKKIKQSISNKLNLDISRVNVKATTCEKMGFIGKEEGISCYATVLIEKVINKV